MNIQFDRDGERIDVALAAATGLSRSTVQRLLLEEMVLCEGKLVRKNARTVCGMTVTVTVPPPEKAEAEAEEIPLCIVYEDSDVLVVNKPKGMVVHPGAGNRTGTLVNALLAHCGDSLSGIGGVVRPGIVHRIDKDTAGLLMVAKNDRAHEALSAQIRTHSFLRVYDCIVQGNLRLDRGTVDAPLARSPKDRKKFAVSDAPRARRAVTHYEVAERFGSFTYVRCRLETGRTHQIRVHMQSLGHPLLGDTVYGGDGTLFARQNRALLRGQCLFAGELGFLHPADGRPMHFRVPLPEEFETLLRKLRADNRK